MKRKFLYNNEGMKFTRVSLRQKQTAPELFLWNLIRRKSTGFKWYRQYSVGKFVLDFYCPKKKLAIEIDGGVHNSKNAQIYDQNRTDFLKLHNS